MNRLEQYIQDRENRFDEEPPVGHFERLQQKIDRKSRRTVMMRWSISVAASVAIIISAGIIFQHTGKQNVELTGCENTDNMKLCYLDKMYDVAGQIDSLTMNLDPWDRMQIITDVQNIIDMADSGLENEIPEELPTNEANLIFSDYYRQNLESLEMIVEDLKIMNCEL